MTSWVADAVDTLLIEKSRTEASRRLLNRALALGVTPEGEQELRFAAEALELAVIDLLDDEDQVDALRNTSADAFQLLRVIDRPDDPLQAAVTCLRIGCLGVLGERGADVSRMLRESPWPHLPIDSPSWDERTTATILDVWLRLLRKDGWSDLDEVQKRVVDLRANQAAFEATYLQHPAMPARTAAWRLVVLYHLAKAAELLAVYTSQGQLNGRFDIRQQLEAQFDRALTASARAEIMDLDPLTRLLARTAGQLVDNSIWTVTRAVNSRVTDFVKHLVSRQQVRPIFEMLPPQRRTLREQGLLGSGHRAVVVNLPTSSGKTLIAQFRILQALNQFDREQGWVVYLAPTRALVNQICGRLRSDFAPLQISVERVSPALEVDGLEASLLTDDSATKFRVLVTTPEKLDLMLRGGWEEKIRRPLTLVVVDEAHNIAQKERGIKLELLLATINRECRYAQFLLMTPFIHNATEIARWLSPDSYKDIELGLDWRPNDLAVLLSRPIEGSSAGEFSLEFETLHTSKPTLSVPEELSFAAERPLGLTWSGVRHTAIKLAAATAQILKRRGPLIVLAQTIPHTWSLADNFKHAENEGIGESSEDVELVRRYLTYEFGQDFALTDLLSYGVAVHHSGLSDEARALVEWLLENEHIQVLVATTTIAQGVNFPVAGVVMASYQYPYGEEMPPEDFWNLAGRTGRIEQGSVGIVALAATDDAKAERLRQFVSRQVESLNSTLIAMVQEAMSRFGHLELHRLFYEPSWSSFLQYLAHTYRQIGDPDQFAEQVENVLRGTLGFERLRRDNRSWANELIVSVQAYGERIAGKPLKLVDSTGFSWESVVRTLSRLSEERIREDVWDEQQLFAGDTRSLRKLMGILLQVPELRSNLEAATGGPTPDGNLLARIVRDWVNGATLPQIASEYFAKTRRGKKLDATAALTECCKNIFGKLIQTASWGLAALQSMTFGEGFEQLSETDQQKLRNLPARVFYGVRTDEAIALRLLGVPRGAAQPLANSMATSVQSSTLPQLRSALTQSEANTWTKAMGKPGEDYFKVWRILERLD